jgi:ornithine decarboxylase
MQKIAYAAPGADVFLRILVENCEADWPLSRKFGCSEENAVALLKLAKSFGLNPRGLSFHVGSQTREPEMWEGIIQKIASVWQDAHDSGIELDLLNIGGGFPATYVKEPQSSFNLNAYTQKVMFFLRKYLHSFPKNIMLEPGRALVANAGLIRAEVVLVSRKRPSDLARWVYLDIGKFSGLAETMDEAIRYPIETPMDHSGEFGPCVLAGPSCDSADVLYEKRPVQLPVDLKAGDEVRILCTGAYTSTYSSVNFNGFKPLETVCL